MEKTLTAAAEDGWTSTIGGLVYMPLPNEAISFPPIHGIRLA